LFQDYNPEDRYERNPQARTGETHRGRGEVRPLAGPDEFLNKAVYHYVVARDLGEEYSREQIEEKIARGLAQVERGETVDGDEFFEQLRLRGEELRCKPA